MKEILAIYRRELGSYFVSPIAYIVVGLFLIATGVYFYIVLTAVSQNAMMQAARGGPGEFDVPSEVINIFFGFVSFIILFLVPFLTMGVYAEERKRGTMELLMTSPVTELQIVVGKFLAAFTLFAAMMAPTFIYHVVMNVYSEPAIPWKVLGSAYLGTLLLGGALVAIGTFISSLTESQIVAGIATVATFLVLLFFQIGVRDATSTWGEVLQHLSILQHFEDFGRGIIDTTSVVYYVTLMALALFLTLRALDSMRWRRA